MAHRDLPQLIDALCNTQVYPHPVEEVEVIETHISWVLLAGEYAYKVKKPVAFEFLDFSSLEKRRQACREELRLNRRLAPMLYLDLLSITGSEDRPVLGGHGPVLEYAVKMRRFPQEAQLDHRLESGQLNPTVLEAAAGHIASFHEAAPRASEEGPYGSPERIHEVVVGNLGEIEALGASLGGCSQLVRLRRWLQGRYEALAPRMAGRKRHGFIRECHGDLHLANMVHLQEGVVAFDCIEFDPALRWIDVASEVAFLMMDLAYRGRNDLAYRFINAYLEETGDYAGLALLPYYLVYRALVRAKVAAIQYRQSGHTAAGEERLLRDHTDHVELAEVFTQPRRPLLVITFGLSGAGKSWLSRELVDRLLCLQLRSDRERKRLFGLGSQGRSGSGLGTGLYTAEASRQTYDRLLGLAETVLEAGYPVIVDAAFLEGSRRARFRQLAKEQQVPFVILECQAVPARLRERIAHRQATGGDVSEADAAVLEHQLHSYDPLDETERQYAVPVCTDTEVDPAEVHRRICDLASSG